MTLKDLSISELAGMVRKDWEKVSAHAEPYLLAMGQLHNIKDNYYADSGEMIVAYFLSNAVPWRGNLAREIKKELNRRLKGT